MSEPVDRLCDCLEGRSVPASAVEIATALGFLGNRESRRRRVREYVEVARANGQRVCANGSGYWLARNNDEWKSFQASRHSRTVFRFVRDRKHREAAIDRGNKQGELFRNPKTGASSAWTR